MSKERQFCNMCNGFTNHEVIGEPVSHSSEPVTWILWQCCGCDDVFLLKQIFTPSADLDDEDSENEQEPTSERIPPKIEYHLPAWVSEINERNGDPGAQEFQGQVETSIRQLMAEIYTALNYGAYNLACTGLRTVLDCVFVNKIGGNIRVRASFEEKLQAMIDEGLLSTQGKDKLNVVIEVGNASAHRGLTPPPHILNEALQITEHLLQELYIHPRCVEALRNITPSVR
jgi:hypothetical protein